MVASLSTWIVFLALKDFMGKTPRLEGGHFLLFVRLGISAASHIGLMTTMDTISSFGSEKVILMIE